MWENTKNIAGILDELYDVLKKLTSKEIKNMLQFITIRKMSGKWPYNEIKEKIVTEEKFKKYFSANIDKFDRVYEQWKEYAKRNTSDKTTVSERDN